MPGWVAVTTHMILVTDSPPALYRTTGDWFTQRGRVMKRAIEKETLQALIETGAGISGVVGGIHLVHPPENDQTLSITPSITSPST